MARAFGADDYADGESEEAGQFGADMFGGSRIPVQELETGQELIGVVQGVRPWGCFVDVGADRDGLVHVSHITGDFVESIYDVIQPGQEVTVWVKQVTEEGKLSLSMVKEKATAGAGSKPDLRAFKSLSAEDWLPGVVKSVQKYGAFVEVAALPGSTPATGLVHITDMRDGFISDPSEVVQVGQSVQVRVVNTDLFSRRLSLSMKDPSPSREIRTRPQDVSAFNQVSGTEWFTGRVMRTTNIGAFVEVEPPGGGNPVKGLVHVKHMQEDGIVDDPAQVVDEGQEVRVRVISVEPYSGRIGFSMTEP